ncbi:MAG: pgpB [Bacilli bacterium]|nr:pgpB [Bacilli bacterium]
MNLKLQLTKAFFLGLFSAICFAFVALLINDQKIARFDSTIISFFQGFESSSITVMMKFFTAIGSGWIISILAIVIILFLYKVLHHRFELILFAWVLIGSALLNILLKMIFQRSRPILHRIIDVNGFSFPSGHSMAAFTLYGILSFLLWRHITTRLGRMLLLIGSAFIILMIGISRIYLGVHYPSDVLGGYLASGCWLAVSIWFYQGYQERRYEKNK